MPIQGHLGVAWGGIHGMFSGGYGMALCVKLGIGGPDIARCTHKVCEMYYQTNQNITTSLPSV